MSSGMISLHWDRSLAWKTRSSKAGAMTVKYNCPRLALRDKLNYFSSNVIIICINIIGPLAIFYYYYLHRTLFEHFLLLQIACIYHLADSSSRWVCWGNGKKFSSWFSLHMRLIFVVLREMSDWKNAMKCSHSFCSILSHSSCCCLKKLW